MSDLIFYQGVLHLRERVNAAHDTDIFRFDVSDLTLNNTKAGHFDFIPGQFISLEVAPQVWRAYSIASIPSDDKVELLIRFISGGRASEILRNIPEGSSFRFRGGFGDFVLPETPDTKLTFCATGTGIAPFRSLIRAEALSPSPRPMKLLYGAQTLSDMAYLGEIASWAPHLQVLLGVSRQSELGGAPFEARNCRITKFLLGETFTPQTEFYICGNGDMVRTVQDLLLDMGVKKEHVHKERFN